MSKMIKKIFMKLDVVAEESKIQKRKRFDPWTYSKRSKSEHASFKSELIKFYGREDKKGRNDKIRCMVVHKSYPRDKVIASHIWKFATHGEGLKEFNLMPKDINSVRNGMLLCDAIEKAF